MGFKLAAHLVGVLMLTAGLAGCIDARVDVSVTSMTDAKTVITQVMAPDFYAMVKTSAAEAGADAAPNDDAFCAQDTLSENPDGSATCVMAQKGPFASLTKGHVNTIFSFSPAGAGLVRIALPTANMKAEIGLDEVMDADTQAMVEAFFEGHTITLHFSGLDVVETNMTLAKDHKSAETIIPFADLIRGDAGLPATLFAVVRVQ